MGHGPMIPRSGLARRSTNHCTLLHAGPIRSHGQDPRGPFSVKWWRYEQERPEEKLLENSSASANGEDPRWNDPPAWLRPFSIQCGIRDTRMIGWMPLPSMMLLASGEKTISDER